MKEQAQAKKYMLKSRILMFALFLSVIISIILSGILLRGYTTRIYTSNLVLEQQLHSNLRSAIQFVFTNNVNFTGKNNATLELFENNTIELHNESYGLFNKLTVSSQIKHLKDTICLLYGGKINKNDMPALYLADDNTYLSLSGRATLNGELWLPRKGVKRSYVGGKTLTGSLPQQSQINKSRSRLPEINESLLQGVKKQRQSASTGSSQSNALLQQDSLINSFSDEPLCVSTSGELVLENKVLQGNILLSSSKGIRIYSSCQITDICCFAPYIIIEDNFKGSFQAFATDSLIIEKNCHLHYPSAIALSPEGQSPGDKMHISIKENSIIEGCVCVLSTGSMDNNTMISIYTDAKLTGIVYTNGMIEHKGIVNGSMYCNKLITITKSATYENTLMDGIIDGMKFPEQYVFPDFFEEKRKSVLRRVF